jgi:hypothetical protein
VIKAATTASAQEIVKGVRKFWPEDSGVSKRAVTKKILPTKGGFTAIIGVDKDVSAEVRGRQHVPANIDHLVEFGFQHVSGQTVAAVAPLRRGHAASKAAAEAKFASKAKQALEREAAKK